MNRLVKKRHNQQLRKKRVRQTISGTAKKPRLSVYVSNRHITAQLINDEDGNTIVYVSTANQANIGKSFSERAEWAGTALAKKATTKKIKQVVFDRGSKLYHGRLKALASSARAAGLEF